MNLRLRGKEHVGVYFEGHVKDHADNRNKNKEHPRYGSSTENVVGDIKKIGEGAGSGTAE